MPTLGWVQSNIVFFDVEGTGLLAAEIADRLGQRGIKIGAMGRYSVRAVTHLDVDRGRLKDTASARRVVAGARRRCLVPPPPEGDPPSRARPGASRSAMIVGEAGLSGPGHRDRSQ